MNTATAPPTSDHSHSPADHEVDHEMERAAAARLKMGWGQRAVVVLLLTVVLVPPLAGFYSYFSGVPLHLLAVTKKEQEAEESDASSVSLVSGLAHTLEVSDDVAAALGIRKGEKDAVEVARKPSMMRPLLLPGSTDFDPSCLARIRARFAPARVVEIGQIRDYSRPYGQSEFRGLRPGDPVTKGEILGVFYSVDVGSKKNDLLQALVQLELDQKILDEANKHVAAVPKVFMLNYERAVQGDRNELSRALNNLKLWDIPQDEIDALRTEARKISADRDAWKKTPEGRWVLRAEQAMEGKEHNGGKIDPGKEHNGGKIDPGKEHNGGKIDPGKEHDGGKVDPGKEHNGKMDLGKDEENPWGRVTLRSPIDGIVIEYNVTKDEMVVDNTVNLFQIADVHRLLVKAHCPEDQLPALEALDPNHRKWTVQTVGTGSPAGLSGTIDEISFIIDPNQHTAVIKGYVENPGKHIRAGQYVTATVNIPPPDDVVEIPTDALVDDGKQSLVFVQPDPSKHQFTMRRVHVTHRFERTVFVRDTPLPKEEQLTALEAEEGLLAQQPLLPGERVLLAGSVELKRVVIDLESRPQRKPAEQIARARARSAPGLESRPEQKPKAGKG